MPGYQQHAEIADPSEHQETGEGSWLTEGDREEQGQGRYLKWGHQQEALLGWDQRAQTGHGTMG